MKALILYTRYSVFAVNKIPRTEINFMWNKIILFTQFCKLYYGNNKNIKLYLKFGIWRTLTWFVIYIGEGSAYLCSMRKCHFLGVQGDREGDHLEEEQEMSKAPENHRYKV